MSIINKPQFNTVWASAGTRSQPSAEKVSQGWVVEIPPFELDNWIQNRQDAMLAHLNQLGVVQWDKDTEYQTGKSYVQGVTYGNIYRCLITNTNANPELDVQGYWEIAFQRSGEALLKSQNLADVPDKALARQNLGIATTSDYDQRFLQTNQNLADIPNKASARGNLGLGGSAVLNVGSEGGTVAAGNDPRIVNATPNTRQVVTGGGLSGGGNLASDRIISLGTPAHVSAFSGNSVVGSTHTHALDLSSFLPTSWANVTNDRASGVQYRNTTGKLMFVQVSNNPDYKRGDISAYVDGVLVGVTGVNGSAAGTSIFFVVPINATYWCTFTYSPKHNWVETR